MKTFFRLPWLDPWDLSLVGLSLHPSLLTVKIHVEKWAAEKQGVGRPSMEDEDRSYPLPGRNNSVRIQRVFMDPASDLAGFIDHVHREKELEADNIGGVIIPKSLFKKVGLVF